MTIPEFSTPLDRERRAYIILAHVVEAENKDVWRYVEQYGPEETIKLLRNDPQCQLRLDSLDLKVDFDKQAERFGARIVTPHSEEWPAAFEELECPPLVLWVKGANLYDLGARISIVGSRMATPYGTQIASDWAASLARRGNVIVSGGAFGIDEAAHRGAMAADGETILVTAAGINLEYPAAHRELFHRVVETGGAVVTEQPPNRQVMRHRFLARNRIIAALGSATLVVESGMQSGTFNTVRHAEELGRPIYAVPGPITSKASEGTNDLIRSGRAKCVTDPKQI